VTCRAGPCPSYVMYALNSRCKCDDIHEHVVNTFRASDEPGTPMAEQADNAQTEAERRAKLQQHLSAALSTAIIPCQPMVIRSADKLTGSMAEEPGEDAPEDAAYWDLVCGMYPGRARKSCVTDYARPTCLYRTQVYILYPEAVNLAGPAAVHDLVPNWNLLERVLSVRAPLDARHILPSDHIRGAYSYPEVVANRRPNLDGDSMGRHRCRLRRQVCARLVPHFGFFSRNALSKRCRPTSLSEPEEYLGTYCAAAGWQG